MLIICMKMEATTLRMSLWRSMSQNMLCIHKTCLVVDLPIMVSNTKLLDILHRMDQNLQRCMAKLDIIESMMDGGVS